MQYCLNNRYCFVHIPKTAGSSLRDIFPHGIISYISHDNRNPDFNYLKSYKLKKNRDSFIFTFVRNPWDRAVSGFHFLNNGGIGCEGDEEDRINFFEKYKNNFELFVKGEFASHTKILNQLHFKPQYEWICNDSLEILVDFVGKFENLEKDMIYISDKIGLPIESIPHTNKTSHKDYRSYYNEETKRIIEEAYKTDIELFGYNFENE